MWFNGFRDFQVRNYTHWSKCQSVRELCSNKFNTILYSNDLFLNTVKNDSKLFFYLHNPETLFVFTFHPTIWGRTRFSYTSTCCNHSPHPLHSPRIIFNRFRPRIFFGIPLLHFRLTYIIITPFIAPVSSFSSSHA